MRNNPMNKFNACIQNIQTLKNKTKKHPKKAFSYSSFRVYSMQVALPKAGQTGRQRLRKGGGNVCVLIWTFKNVKDEDRRKCLLVQRFKQSFTCSATL